VSQQVLANAQLATFDGDGYGLIEAGAIVIEGERIVWIGPESVLPAAHADAPRRDMGRRLITPAPIDCHTHLVFGGDRAREFALRLEGASYEEIARAGGGILSTVKATREADEETLLARALPRLDALIVEGVTTLEVKSGYGLDQETELRMLRVARRLAHERPVRICTTHLCAHACPPEYEGRKDAFIDEVCIPSLHAAHAEGLVDAVDGFCEGIAFNTSQIARVFDAARECGLPVKLHAEQLSHQGGTALAAHYGALSADHVEYATEADAQLMAESRTVAVILPGAFYTLHEKQLPPVTAFREHGVPMALSTDCNPGSSPLTSILLAMNMGCTLFRLTPAEALRGVTVNAARALGLDDCGRIAPGLRADLAVWDVDDPAELAWRIGFNPLYERIFRGVSC